MRCVTRDFGERLPATLSARAVQAAATALRSSAAMLVEAAALAADSMTVEARDDLDHWPRKQLEMRRLQEHNLRQELQMSQQRVRELRQDLLRHQEETRRWEEASLSHQQSPEWLQLMQSQGGAAAAPRLAHNFPEWRLTRYHSQGTCKPCLYWYGGLCHKGQDCNYCHMEHSGEHIRRVRASKKTKECLERRDREAQAGVPVA